jgi:hypothetical protein
MPDKRSPVNRGLLRPRDWAPLLELMREDDTEPRFACPAHSYAQTTRRALAERLQDKTAAPAGRTRHDAA